MEQEEGHDHGLQSYEGCLEGGADWELLDHIVSL
jgi:hypothetical protein